MSGAARIGFVSVRMEEIMEYDYQAHMQKQKPQPPQLQPERRRVIKKPPSIHDVAYSGDLKNVQMKLQENGALINLRNPVVSPLCLFTFDAYSARYQSFLIAGLIERFEIHELPFMRGNRWQRVIFVGAWTVGV